MIAPDCGRFVLAEAHAIDTKLVSMQERSDETEAALHERRASSRGLHCFGGTHRCCYVSSCRTWTR